MNKELVSIVVVTRNRKRDLDLCLKSLMVQSHKNIEIIVVDNASDKSQKKWINKKYKNIKVLEASENLGGAGGRNLGIKSVNGKCILFIDDDAYADSKLVSELLKTLKKKGVGVVQPKIFDRDKKDVLQGVGHGINLFTGRVFGVGIGEKDQGQFEKEMEIPMAGCTWMVKKEVIEKIGGYDEDYFIPYEDSDFSWRARKSGYKVMLSPRAIVWHQGSKITAGHPRLQWLGITTPDKAFRVSRNKIIFMKKHAPFINFVVFMILFLPFYNIAHSLIIFSTRRLDVLFNYWRGNLSGLLYILIHLT